MADTHHQEQNRQLHPELPQVIVLKSPPVFRQFEDHFSSRFHLLKAWESELPQDQYLATYAQSAQAILCFGSGPRISADIIRQLPSLRLVVTTSAGLNHIDLSECRARGIAVANAGDVFSADCADYAVGLLIDVLRKISASDRYVRNGNWAILGDFGLGSKLGSKRVGIVGLGKIGLEVAKRLEAFGCSISYNSRKKKEHVAYPFYANVCELAADMEVLIICCGLTEQTRHMIDRKVLLALGKEGVVVNIGRGAIINEKEMVQCLVQGEIGGAGLDVFENEPNVPKELFALDNVVLSPHLAVFTPESFEDLRDIMIGNLEAFFSNKPLLSLVADE
ncbi:hypothetical protein FNV43_RR16181 [Rhamnella rubrinervis]|uniref:glyoxylate reductase (NADP(+)) n=1 Tax=Rhamnella rubrinervis TaxID=2594499 RepID=A0A8K0E335_9ROSA|nr:hypothetical protein FNV43_RR16181 [Rhamnella rubrinervis]